MNSIISKNISRFRNLKKLTQAEVALQLGIEPNTYSYWESNKCDIKSKYIPKLAEIFEVEIADLFTDNKNETINLKLVNKNKDTASGNNIIIMLPNQESVDKVVDALNGVLKK